MTEADVTWAGKLLVELTLAVLNALRAGKSRTEAVREAKGVLDRRRQIDDDVDEMK